MNNTDKNIPLNTCSNQNVIYKKRIRLCMILGALILFGLSCFVLSPLYVLSATNIVYSTTVLPELLDLLNTVCDIVAYAVCFSCVIYSIFLFSVKRSLHLVYIYCAAVFLKYTANVVLQVFFDGALPQLSDLAYVLASFIFDVITAVVIIFIAKGAMKIKSQKETYLPFQKLYSASNPLQRASLFTGIFLSAIRVLTRVIYDMGIGAPTDILDLLWMILYYMLDISICFIIYLLSLLVITFLNKKNI